MNRHDKRSKQQLQTQGKENFFQAQSWNYPIPPPDDFQKFPPEIQKAFLTEWEKEGDHRRNRELKEMDLMDLDLKNKSKDITLTKLLGFASLFCSWSIVFGLGLSGIYLLILGRDIQSLIVFVGALTSFWIFRNKKN